MAAPTFVAAGTVGTTSAALPAGWAQNDIFLLCCQSSNQVIAVPSGYTEVDLQAHMATGTAATAGSVRLMVAWKRAGSSESAVTVTNPGNRIMSQLLGFRGCETSGNPWNVVGSGVYSGSLTNGGWKTYLTSAWLNGGSITPTNVFTTTADETRVVCIEACAQDTNSTTLFASATAPLLTSFAMLAGVNNITNTGTGGGIGGASGTLATAGNAAAPSNELGITSYASTAGNFAVMVLALKPPAPLLVNPVLPNFANMSGGGHFF